MESLIGTVVRVGKRMYKVQGLKPGKYTTTQNLDLIAHEGEVPDYFPKTLGDWPHLKDGVPVLFSIPTAEEKSAHYAARYEAGLYCGPTCWCFTLLAGPPKPRTTLLSEETEAERIEACAKCMHALAWGSYVEDEGEDGQNTPPEGVDRPRLGGNNIYDLMPPVPEAVRKVAEWAVSIAPAGLSGMDVGYCITGSGGCSGEGPDWKDHPTIELMYYQGDNKHEYLWTEAPVGVNNTGLTTTEADRVRFWRGY